MLSSALRSEQVKGRTRCATKLIMILVIKKYTNIEACDIPFQVQEKKYSHIMKKMG
jgi:hypothetical protein